MQGAIRREANMPGAFDWAMPWLLFFALTIGITQFIFVYNFVRTMLRKPTEQEQTEYEQKKATAIAGPRPCSSGRLKVKGSIDCSGRKILIFLYWYSCASKQSLFPIFS